MSKIDDLILQYCPDGVEWKRIEEVCKVKTPPAKLKTSDYQEQGLFQIIDQGQQQYAGYTDNEKAVVEDGEYILYGDHTCIVKYHKGPFAQGADGLKILTSKANNSKYVYYALSAYNLTNTEYKRHWTQAKEIEIPLPPLPVQEEIVKILDRFTVYAAELQAELQARQQQYNYYRDTLLSFEGREDVRWMKLGEVCAYSKERIGVEEVNADNYVSVENLLPNQRGKERASNVPKEGNCIKFEPNDILVGNIRPYLHKIWFADCVGGTNGDVLCFKIKREAHSIISPRYLYCILSSHSFFGYDNSYAKGAKMPRGDKRKVMEYTLPIPSLAEQQRIVDILDRFDTLTNDLSQGLPAEIEARQRQYEYYRDRLLTFKRKSE